MKYKLYNSAQLTCSVSLYIAIKSKFLLMWMGLFALVSRLLIRSLGPTSVNRKLWGDGIVIFVYLGLHEVWAELHLVKKVKAEEKKEEEEFRWQRWGSSLPGLRTRDPPLGPPWTPAEICWRTCLQSHLQTSPPTYLKSYLKFRNPRTTFENTPLFRPKMP